MASFTTTTPTLPSDRQGNVIPANVIAQKRKQRDERRKLMASTMASDGGLEQEAGAQ